MPAFATINAFNAGILSPKLAGRANLDIYSRGCLQLENFFVSPQGAAESRPGTSKIAETKFQTGNERIVPFVRGANRKYLLEFGDRYIRIFRDNLIKTEIVSPFAENELAKLKFVQSNDVLFIASSQRMIQQLRRTGNDSFAISELPLKYPPVREMNASEITVKPNAIEGPVQLEASGDIFLAGHAGGYLTLEQLRAGSSVEHKFTRDDTLLPMEIRGAWTLRTSGTWNGTLTLQRSGDGGILWNNYASWTSDEDNNVDTSGVEDEENIFYRLKMENYSLGDSAAAGRKCVATLSNQNNIITGVVRINLVSDSRHASGSIVRKLGSTDPTRDWGLPAWCDAYGFPRAIACFEERLMLAGSAAQPQTIWGSKTSDWNNFLLGDKDDDAVEFTISSGSVNEILWMTAQNVIVVGTADSEWILSGGDSYEPITPASAYPRKQGAFGSADIQAVFAGDIACFVQRGKAKLRGFIHDIDRQISFPDFTVFSDRVLAGKVRDLAVQSIPNTLVWCVLDDGSCAVLNYERDQQVLGWSQISTQGRFLGCAVIPGDDAEDIVYTLVRRNQSVIIEQFAPREIIPDQLLCLDCATVIENFQSSDITGLDALDGLTVSIFGDNAFIGTQTVRHGRIHLDENFNRLVVGLPFVATLETMPVETETQNGLTSLRRKAAGEIRVSIYDSVGGEVTAGIDAFQELYSRDAELDSMDQRVKLKSGIQCVPCAAGYEKSLTVKVRQTQPFPLNVAMIGIIYNIVE